jgi:hypothetical protein
VIILIVLVFAFDKNTFCSDRPFAALISRIPETLTDIQAWVLLLISSSYQLLTPGLSVLGSAVAVASEDH